MYFETLANYLKHHHYQTKISYRGVKNQNPIRSHLTIYHQRKKVAQIDLEQRGVITITQMIKPAVAQKLLKFSQTEIPERFNDQIVKLNLPDQDYRTLGQLNTKFQNPNRNQQIINVTDEQSYMLTHLKRQLKPLKE